jgi:hypothetical protein
MIVEVRVAERSVPDHVPDEDPVLLVDRHVKVEGVADALAGNTGAITSGDQRGRVPRHDVEDQVRDHRRSDEQEDRPEQAPEEEPDRHRGSNLMTT